MAVLLLCRVCSVNNCGLVVICRQVSAEEVRERIELCGRTERDAECSAEKPAGVEEGGGAGLRIRGSHTPEGRDMLTIILQSTFYMEVVS